MELTGRISEQETYDRLTSQLISLHLQMAVPGQIRFAGSIKINDRVRAFAGHFKNGQQRALSPGKRNSRQGQRAYAWRLEAVHVV